MKTIKSILAVLSVILFLGLVGCQKATDLQNVKSALTVVMDNTAETLVKTTKTVQFDSGYIYVTAVDVYGELENENENDDNYIDNDGDSKDEYVETDEETYFSNRVDINTRIDLATGAYEVPIEFDLLATNYDDIKFNIYLDAFNTYPAIEVYGTYTDTAGNLVPVAFIYNDSIAIRVELDNDFDDVDEDLIVSDSIPAFTIRVSPARWFKDVSSDLLENATRYDGVILINDTANVDIYNIIVNNVGKECELEIESRERWENEYHSENFDD